MNPVSVFYIALLSTLPLAAQTAPATQPAPATHPAPLAQPTPASPSDQAQEIEQLKAKLADWAQLDRYRAENADSPPVASGEQRVVFYGDSITDNWGHGKNFFPDKPYFNRGISGQTTPQMLVRFQQDVVRLQPAAVIILAGTNDIAGNTGPETPQMIEDNFASMAAIAKYYDIKVIFASILPAIVYPWKPGVQPADEIRALNAWLKEFCQRDGDIYLDYYSSMADAQGGMKPGLSIDGVHPTPAGYAIMAPLAENAIAEALKLTEQADATISGPSSAAPR
jgi:lysophospholipase L1-like esterase